MLENTRETVGPVDGRKAPRFAGSATFARLPEIDKVPDYDIAILGAPSDNGTSYRPRADRELLRMLRGLASLNLVSADLVEVSPAYDHAEITSIAAATVIFDIVAMLGKHP